VVIQSVALQRRERNCVGVGGVWPGQAAGGGSWAPRATRGVGTMNEGPLLCHTNLARVALPLGAAPLW